MFRQILNLMTYLIFCVLAGLCALFFRQSVYFLILLVLLCLPAFSYALSRYAFEHLTIQLTCRVTGIPKGSVLPISLTLFNNSFFPIPECQIAYDFSHLYYAKDLPQEIVLPALAKQNTSKIFSVRFDQNGCFRAQLISLKTYDYLHLFSFSRELSSHVEIRVMPNMLPILPDIPAIYEEGFDESEETGSHGEPTANVTDIREYIPGDRLQKIHWKLSSKVRKLMVRENEQNSDNQFFVLTELYSPSAASPFLDSAIDTTYALGTLLLARQESFHFAYYDCTKEDFFSFYIRTREDLEEAMTEMYYTLPYAEEDLAMITLQHSGLQKGTLLQVTHKGVLHAAQ